MYSASDSLEAGNFLFFSWIKNYGKAADITCVFLYPGKEELQLLSHWEIEITKKKNGNMNLNGDKFFVVVFGVF